MNRRTLVIRRNADLHSAGDARRLLDRLMGQPGVESVRIEALPLRVTLRLVTELADEASLRAIVDAQPLGVLLRGPDSAQPGDRPQGAGISLGSRPAWGRSSALAGSPRGASPHAVSSLAWARILLN
jgi:hypothetical protein